MNCPGSLANDYKGDCTIIRWDVDNIKAVYFENQPTTGHNSQQVCPTDTATYTLLVQMLDDQHQQYPIMINVEAYDSPNSPVDNHQHAA